ncbi:AAA family ATPase [Rhodobacterales bacterium]|nr:AAA family ATPase [Rhodobacterales bacterium]
MLSGQLQIIDADIDDLERSEGLKFDEQRRNILKSMGSIDVQACPGSGKTTLIAAKLILLAEKWAHQDRGICVLSHTNAAKNEIISRLQNSKFNEAQRLLSYPHFIGTIQEFAGKFVAFPSLRSDGISINVVDDGICVSQIERKLKHKTKLYLEKKGGVPESLFGFKLIFVDGNYQFQVPGFKKESQSASYQDLVTVRTNLISEGYLFFQDVFAIAMSEAKQNSLLTSSLRQRFSRLFVDEMQDTQAHQDELINQIFYSADNSTSIQRFGDPDQAIFNGIGGGEAPNTSYNERSQEDMFEVINHSHRFGSILANIAKAFSHNEIALTSGWDAERQEAQVGVCAKEGFNPTIFLYNDASLTHVVKSFGDVVQEQFERDELKKIRAVAVGGVGKPVVDPQKDLSISSYWPAFDNQKSKANPAFENFCDAVRYCQSLPPNGYHRGYDILIDTTLKVLRSIGQTDLDGKHFSRKSFDTWLTDNGKRDDFRKILFACLAKSGVLTEQNWNNLSKVACKILSIDLEDAVISSFFIYSNAAKDLSASNKELENIYCHQSGLNIELSTIHRVKGQTHDATLILETKHHCFDVQAMLPHFMQERPTAENKNCDLRAEPHHNAADKANKKFLRLMYVATSRPRHLVCLAMHEDRVSEDDCKVLEANGWQIKEVEVPNA